MKVKIVNLNLKKRFKTRLKIHSERQPKSHVTQITHIR